MLVTILATPRTGSSSLWSSYKSEWWPPEHPMSHGHGEYYNGFNSPAIWKNTLDYKQYLYNIRKNITKEQMHEKLINYVTENPNTNIAIKVFPSHASKSMIKQLLEKSDQVVHAVRKSYTCQLKSMAAAGISKCWGHKRPKVIKLSQHHIDMNHQLLTKDIIEHSQYYKQYGGELFFLEDRFDENKKYPLYEFYPDNLEWPTFDTVSLFDNT